MYVCFACDKEVDLPHICPLDSSIAHDTPEGVIRATPNGIRLSMTKPDPVNAPTHYRAGDTYETIKVLESWLSREEFGGFLKGQIIRYHSRARLKNAHTQDIEKAGWYQKKLEEMLKKWEAK